MPDLSRELGVSDQTHCNWKAKYGGLEINEARRRGDLEEENRRLKHMVADLSRDKEALKAVIRKKGLELVSQRGNVAMLVTEYGYSEREACKLLEMDRSTYRYEPVPDRNEELRKGLKAVAQEKPRYAYRRLHALLERRGWKLNPKRVYLGIMVSAEGIEPSTY